MVAVASKSSRAVAKILIVEDDVDLREALQDTLEMADFEVLAADSGEAALVLLNQHSDVRCVVSDVNMGGMDGHQLLRIIGSEYPQLPVILNTAYASIDKSVEAMRAGAVDYLVKPFEPRVLLETVNRYASDLATEMSHEPIAEDPSSQQLLSLARRVAKVDSTALIIGESGTGKEVLAQYVHAHSSRANKPFVAINCAAIPENMLEAMLFGHEKGAFTGAHTSSPGKFEQANGGTLLLDEISEMDLGLQAKLLRVLQEQEVERLGGRKVIKLDVRVIATSNRDMRSYVAEGKFREDLYFRLSVLPLHWAPLRDRKADIMPLAEKLLTKHANKQYRRGVRLSESAKSALLQYAWPGNVRELDNVMQRALILQPGKSIAAADLGIAAQSQFSAKPSLLQGSPLVETSTPATVSMEAPPTASEEDNEGLSAGEESSALGGDLKQREFEIIVNTLRQERGSKKNTAERLGISPRTLRYKIAKLKELGLDISLAY